MIFRNGKSHGTSREGGGDTIPGIALVQHDTAWTGPAGLPSVGPAQAPESNVNGTKHNFFLESHLHLDLNLDIKSINFFQKKNFFRRELTEYLYKHLLLWL